MILKSSIESMMRGEHLAKEACRNAILALLTPEINPLQIAAFLTALRVKRETAEELTTIVEALREKMVVVPTQVPVLDIVGTGGDGLGTINISTGSAILAASCGVKVAKHGNRASSSLAGSADVLEALGIQINLTPEKVSKSIDEIGIGFCYSPLFHPVMQSLRTFRKQLNIPTTFNLIGPLLNPAQAKHTILGVYDVNLLPIMAAVLQQIGNTHAMIVHGMGLDEISTAGSLSVIEIHGGEQKSYCLDPLDYGLPRCQIDDLRGGDADVNAALLLETFAGKPGAIADTLMLNTAVALYLYGLHPNIRHALQHARDALYSHAANTLLKRWIEFSHDG